MPGYKALEIEIWASFSATCPGGFLAARCGLSGSGDPHDSFSGVRGYKTGKLSTQNTACSSTIAPAAASASRPRGPS